MLVIYGLLTNFRIFYEPPIASLFYHGSLILKTAIFLMAVGRLRELCDRLEHEAGYPGSCPVGIVERASCPGQRVVQVSFNPSQDTIFLPSSSYRTSRLNLTISSWNSFLKCKPLDCDALCHAAPLLLAPVCFPGYSSALIMRRIKD